MEACRISPNCEAEFTATSSFRRLFTSSLQSEANRGRVSAADVIEVAQARRHDRICEWTARILEPLVALHLGAPAIFGLAGQDSIVDMQPSISKLIDDYGLPEVTPAKEIFAIIGNPIFHSLSPRLHNASYRAMNHPALFMPLRVDSFAEFWREFVVSKKLDSLGLPINGMTVASPHKEEAVRTAKTVSGMARQAEAANILIRNNGWWIADTTDPDVVYAASRDRSVHVKENVRR